jgi:hypothetical protein
MKVKLLVSRGGIGFSQNFGDEIEVSAAEGKRMIEAGHAVPVRTAKDAPEKAVRKGAEPEKAVAVPSTVDKPETATPAAGEPEKATEE